MLTHKKLFNFLVVEDNPGDYALVADFLAERFVQLSIVNAASFKQATAILNAPENAFCPLSS